MERTPERPAPPHAGPPYAGAAHPGPAAPGAAEPAWGPPPQQTPAWPPPPAYAPRVYTYDGPDRWMLAGAWLIGFLWLQITGVRAGAPQAGVLLYFLFAHLILFLYTSGRRPARPPTPCLALYAALLALSLPFLLYSNRLLASFNLLALAGLSVVLFLLLRDGENSPWDSPRTLLRGALNLFYLPFAHLARPFGAARSLSGDGRGKVALHVLIGLAAACPLLGLALLWLAGADAVFDRLVLSSLDWLSATFGVFLTRLFLGALLGLLFYSAAYGLRRRALAAAPRAGAGRTPPLVLVTALSLFTLLYALFCAVQFVYLFGGTTSQLPEGVSGYAQYARAGFFELCYVTGLNLALTLGCLHVSDTSRRGLWRTIRAQCALIMGFTAVILASAAYRMGLYIAVHGLTILRTFTLWGMAVMAALIVGVFCKALRPRFRFFRLLTATLLIGYAALNFANIDARIARFNVDRFLSGQMEHAYEEYLIFHLSYDAVPALEALHASGYNEVRYSRPGYTPYATLGEAIDARRAAARQACADLRSMSLSALRAAGP